MPHADWLIIYRSEKKSSCPLKKFIFKKFILPARENTV